MIAGVGDVEGEGVDREAGAASAAGEEAAGGEVAGAGVVTEQIVSWGSTEACV